MSKAEVTRRRSLILDTKAMNAALKRSAERAQLIADAFGQKVPVAQSKIHTEHKTGHYR